MNRGMKIMLLLVGMHVCATTIAAPTHTSGLSGISGKKGISNYVHKTLFALRKPILSDSTLDALKRRLYQRRYYLAALLAVGGVISFQKNRERDRWRASLIKQIDEDNRRKIAENKKKEEEWRIEMAEQWRREMAERSVRNELSRRKRKEIAEQRKIEEEEISSRKEIEDQRLVKISTAQFELGLEGRRIAEQTDPHIRKAKELGVTVWSDKKEFTPILFSNYPSYVLNDKTVQRLWGGYTLKRGNNPLLEPYYSEFGEHDGFFGLFDQGQCACIYSVTPNIILTTLTRDLSNKDAKQKLFCSIVTQFQKDKESLNLNTRITYDKQDPRFFFSSSNSEEGRNLLDSRNPAYQTYIPYKGMVVKHGVNLNPTNDSYPQDAIEEVCFGRGNIDDYYYEVPEKYIKKTLFGTCPDMGVAKRRTDRRLFEAVLYLLIQQMASDPAILSKFIGKQVVVDLNRDEGEDYEKFVAIYELDEEHAVGKNRIGKMITYAIQQILLPENRKLLNAVIAKHLRFHVLMFNKLEILKRIPEGTTYNLLEPIFSYYLPTPVPEVKPVRSRISPPQGQ